MQLDPSILPFLHGSEFSNGLRVNISRPERSVPDRIGALERMAQGMRVLHIGCVDHVPLIEAKRRRGRWLHDRLAVRASQLAGIDLDAEGVAYVTEKLGYEDVFVSDVTRDDPPARVAEQTWDFALLGELVEHLDNPVAFLAAFRTRYAPHVNEVVITTPNAFRIDNFKRARRHVELLNSDHRFWWTPYTLSKVCVRAGLQVREFSFCESYPVPRWNVPRRLTLSRYPALRDTIVLRASLK